MTGSELLHDPSIGYTGQKLVFRLLFKAVKSVISQYSGWGAGSVLRY
jgi:hypothetical protein